MLEAAAYLYIGAGVVMALIDAQGVKIMGVKSSTPLKDAIMRVGVCLFLWPLAVVSMVNGWRR